MLAVLEEKLYPSTGIACTLQFESLQQSSLQPLGSQLVSHRLIVKKARDIALMLLPLRSSSQTALEILE